MQKVVWPIAHEMSTLAVLRDTADCHFVICVYLVSTDLFAIHSGKKVQTWGGKVKVCYYLNRSCSRDSF